jgi:TatD DNase family protein
MHEVNDMLIDTHAHLFWDSFETDFDQMVQRAIEADVKTAINVGIDVETSIKAAKQASNYGSSPLRPNMNSSSSGEGVEKLPFTMYSSIAIHPEEAIKYFKNEHKIAEDISNLEEIYFQYPEKIVAVGECGLDFSYFNHEGYLPEDCPAEFAKELQRELFRAQINLAQKLHLPLLLHVRDDRSQDPELIECWKEAVEMTWDHFGIYHCYSGLLPTTQNLSKNFLVSFAGNITYKKNEYLREAAKMLPLEKICLETDCPFLPPQSIRGQRNEPSSVKEIAQTIADLKGISLEEVANQTTENVKKLLKINL